MNKIRYKIISLLLNENEKCLINQGLNDSKQGIKDDLYNGLTDRTGAYEDIELIENMNCIVKNKLWK